jgi:Zn ribbon nucleic-acid-binding protein
MRWRQSFIAEVSQALQGLGLRACPVCGSADALAIGRFPAFLLDGGPAPDRDDLPLGEDHDYDLTFAVRIECAACGHLMLFNAEKYRTGDEQILVRDRAEEEGQLRE